MSARRYRIQRLRPSDYDELLSVWKRAGLPARPRGRDSRPEMARQVGLGTSIYLKAVLREDGRERMVAVVLGTHDGRKGWINRLAVLPGHRRRGLGTLLVRELERRFRRLGPDIVCGLVETYNQESMAFFAKMGYVRHEDIIYYSKRRSERT
ncbi:MAG: GNAT family N-acetyltransferase [Euryarchaeota archaeon]|nr:GNAT family N-acetyltransferase [Euryarchaeota archaeon]